MLRSALIILVLAVLVARATLAAGTPAPCPEECACNRNGTVGCVECLEGYQRVYKSEAEGCPCSSPDMKQMGLYCCSANCSVCSEIGDCVSCRSEMQLVHQLSGVGTCVCRINYFFDLNENLCRCNSVISPTKFYEVQPEDACYPCPDNCTCSVSGCVSCDESTHRSIVTLRISISRNVTACPCRSPYV